MVTVITHIPFKPTPLQAVLAIYSSARSKDLSEGTSSSIFQEREKKGYDPRTGLLWVTNHSLFSCEVAVRINLMRPSTPRKSSSSTPSSFIHAVMDPDNHSTSTSSLRQALGSTLCPWLSAAAQVSGQTRWSGTTPCQQPPSDSCCCLTNLRAWEKSTESQADSWDMTGQGCLRAPPL